MHNPGTLSGSQGSSLVVPWRQCICRDGVHRCVGTFPDMQRVQARAAWRWGLCRPVLRSSLRTEAGEGSNTSNAPDEVSQNQEQWLDHLLQAAEVLLVISLAAGQFPAARKTWQSLRNSSQFAEKETSTTKVT